MFSFGYPLYLLLLLLVPVFILLYIWGRYWRKKALQRFGKLNTIATLMPTASPYKPPVKITMQMLALAMIILAFARPWGGIKESSSEKTGIEVVIAVDASNSMLAPIDADHPGSQRMRTAKLMLERLIGRLENDRVGLIVYAGNAHTLIPVTNDYLSAKTFLNTIDPQQISFQGTNIAAAIDQAQASFSPQKGVGRAIILITDAEELEDTQGAMAAVENAAKNKIQVDVIGVGSVEPQTIPTPNGPMTDDNGEVVRTALNENLAAQLAKQGNGIYVNASQPDAISDLQKQLSQLQRTTMQSSTLALHDELFYIFAWIALAFLVLDIFILDRRISWLDRINFFKKEVKK